MTKKLPFPLIGLILTCLVFGLTVSLFNHTQTANITFKTSELTHLDSIEKQELTMWHNDEVKFVYFTFDDGPSRNTSELLDILKAEDVPGTFFLLGDSIERVADSKELVARIANEGHYLGLHSMTHVYDTLYKGPNAPQNFVNEMFETQELIAEYANGFKSTLVRAPYGTGGGTFTPNHVTAVANAGLKVWDWDVDSVDWSDSPSQIIENLKTFTEIKADQQHLIVLFHEKDTTLQALPQAIKYYRDLGYEFAAYDPDHHVVSNFMQSDEL